MNTSPGGRPRSALSDAALTAKDGEAAELWCNEVTAEVLVSLTALGEDYAGTPDDEEIERLAKRYRVSTLVALRRIFDAGLLGWDEYLQSTPRSRNS